MGHIGWLHIIAAGWPVLSILFVGSIITIAVAWERWKVFRSIHTDSDSFVLSVRKNRDVEKIVQWCDKSDQPLALITKAIFTARAQRDDKERMLHRAIQSLVQRYETHIPLLGTIASVAPFVGLLGTVIGIIRSFAAVSMGSAEGASLVAVGIAEALVGTAGGLVVAIPAILAYNYFVNRLRRFTQDWELVGAELIDLALHMKGS